MRRLKLRDLVLALGWVAAAGAAQASFVFTSWPSPLPLPSSLGFSNSTQSSLPLNSALPPSDTGGPFYNFLDSWNFRLNPGADVGGFVGSLNFTDGNGAVTTGINNLELRLWSYDEEAVVVGGAWQSMAYPGSLYVFSVIAPTVFASGDYALQVRGLTVGPVSSYGGNFTAVPTAVPLPAALPLLLAGLGLMGVVGHRKKGLALAA